MTAQPATSQPVKARPSSPRIYVLPTRLGGAFVLLSLLTLVGCINYLLSLGYALTFLLLSVWVVCAVHASRALVGAGVKVTLPDRAFAGAPLSLGAALTAPALATQPLGLRVGTALLWLEGQDESVGQAAGIQVAGVGADSASGTLTLPAFERGPQRLPTLRLEGHDPLGLWRSSVYPAAGDMGSSQPPPFLVYPAPEEQAPPPPLDQHTGQAAETRRAAGDEEVHGLREYRPGDAPRRIAWKQAARTGTLFTRTYDAPQAAALALDYGATAAGDTEARVSRLCAWVLEAERRGCEFSLELPGTRLERAAGDAQVRRALELLARYERPELPPLPARRWPGPSLREGRP
ncbi:DUF58 domain-containing protein [Deinococcus altitudinis]|uniref:DUF58 domain-containing protein n=1 Tax=Deinococcus altitudinis TaxID=468914 RepID=UPI00389289F3